MDSYQYTNHDWGIRSSGGSARSTSDRVDFIVAAGHTPVGVGLGEGS